LSVAPLFRAARSLALAAWLCGVAAQPAAAEAPYPSTYRPLPSQPTLFRGATILTATGALFSDSDLLVENGKIAAIGKGLGAPAKAVVVDAHGKWLTPGLIEIHAHLGGKANPETSTINDALELSSPNTAEVWVEHSLWPEDPAFSKALAGGVTTMQVLPGSANLFGGRSVTLKNVPSTTVQGMKFPGAPYGLKMACGENPKSMYGEQHVLTSRMGEMAGYRKAWLAAADYKQGWDAWRKAGAKAGAPPPRDLAMDTLAGALAGEITVQIHCMRADDMANLIDLSKEFGFQISAFHHAIDAYKIAPLLAQNHICAAVFAGLWGGAYSKMESYDQIAENAAMVDAVGGCAIIHSDSEYNIQRMNQEAAKAMAAGRRAGIDITPEHAIQWITLNPAKAMGIAATTGSLEAGKAADVVMWSGDPFSVYALVDQVLIDGAVVYDRATGLAPVRDFELGQPALGAAQ